MGSETPDVPELLVNTPPTKWLIGKKNKKQLELHFLRMFCGTSGSASRITEGQRTRVENDRERYQERAGESLPEASKLGAVAEAVGHDDVLVEVV